MVLGRTTGGLLAAFALILTGAHAPLRAQSLETCAEDLSTYCAAVTPGEGRIAACLYAHADKISDACLTAAEEPVLQIDFALARLRHAHEVCTADIQSVCQSDATADGSVLFCLADNREAISDECGAIVDAAVTSLEQ